MQLNQCVKKRSRMKPRRWSEAQRRAQALRMKQTRAWERSTGPRSEAGKARSALNATKHGAFDRTYRRLHAVLRAHAQWLRVLNERLRTEEQIARRRRKLSKYGSRAR